MDTKHDTQEKLKELEQEYEKSSMLYHVIKADTKAKDLIGKRMDRAAKVLKEYRLK